MLLLPLLRSRASRLVLHQARYDLRAFLRNKQARFYTLLLPLVFLVVFVLSFGNDRIGPHHLKAATYYVPGLAAMAVMSASFVNLVVSVTAQRELGVLKRRRSTPVPPWALIGGRALTSIAVSLGVTAVLIVVGRTGYDATVPTSALPGIVLTVLVGSAAFTALGYALSAAIRSADAAQPVVQAVMLPLYFISGIFVPDSKNPAVVQHVAELLPAQHLAHGLRNAFEPGVHGTGVVWSDLAVLLAWAVVGLVLALRRFAWAPQAATA